MEIKRYPDGSSYALLPDKYNDAVTESYFTYKINSYEDLWQLGQLLEAFNYKGISPCVTIPNLIDAQADRRFGNSSNQSFGLKMVCKFLNQFDALYQIFHPHNPEVVEALMDNVEIIDNSEFIDIVLDSFDKHWKATHLGNKDNHIKDNMILIASDAGGFKPLMKLCDKIGWQGETYSASKARSYVDGKSKLTQIVDREDFGGKDILIIDDICVYGGTFKGLSKILRRKNVGKLYLAVSHMTVKELGTDPVTDFFDKVFTTNSKYDHYLADGNRGTTNLHILKLF